jgi:1-acyl-sn-glycerol-3-phosphate acyltransferase
MSLFDKDNRPLADEHALRSHIERALAAKPPQGLEMDITYRLVQRVFSPEITGAENIPERPCMFVGNHSLFALDGAVLTPIFLKKLRRFTRAMGDKFLFSNRTLADYLLSLGIVMGHPDVCSALMEAEQDLLLFPGGAYEAVKPVSRLYELQWKDRFGFIKLAATHGYTIMPFGLVGPDEFYGHLIEGQDLPHTVLGRLLTRLGVLHADTRTDILPPIPIGTLGTIFPKPQRCYLGFGQGVDLARYKGKSLSKKTLHAVRNEVASQIEAQLTGLLATRDERKGQDSLLRRILTL